MLAVSGNEHQTFFEGAIYNRSVSLLDGSKVTISDASGAGAGVYYRWVDLYQSRQSG